MSSINQTYVAKKAGIQRTYLCEILNGKKEMGRRVAVAIGQAFDLDPAKLIFAPPEDLKKMLAEAHRAQLAPKQASPVSRAAGDEGPPESAGGPGPAGPPSFHPMCTLESGQEK